MPTTGCTLFLFITPMMAMQCPPWTALIPQPGQDWLTSEASMWCWSQASCSSYLPIGEISILRSPCSGLWTVHGSPRSKLPPAHKLQHAFRLAMLRRDGYKQQEGWFLGSVHLHSRDSLILFTQCARNWDLVQSPPQPRLTPNLCVHVCRFAHIQDMARGSTTLVFTFYPGMRLQSRAAMGVAISRLIEERVGLAEGMEGVRKWLIIISAILFSCLSQTHA